VTPRPFPAPVIRCSPQRGFSRAMRSANARISPGRVLTFEVGRVYKGTAGKRQEVVTSLGSAHAHSRAPFVIFANKPSPAMSHQYEVDLGQYTFGLESRALAGGARGRGT
jgi:hypothetical protein